MEMPNDQVTKSFVNGRFVPVTQLRGHLTRDLRYPPSQAKLKDAVRGQYKKAKGSGNAKGQKIYPDAPYRSKQRKLRKEQTDYKGTNFAAVAYPDGRGGGVIASRSKLPNRKSTMDHEMEHIRPRRNPYRLNQRIQDSVRSGREEGRADYMSGQLGYPTDDPDFYAGYLDVQLKMTKAGTRRRVSKSMEMPNDLGEIGKSLVRTTAGGQAWVKATKLKEMGKKPSRHLHKINAYNFSRKGAKSRDPKAIEHREWRDAITQAEREWSRRSGAGPTVLPAGTAAMKLPFRNNELGPGTEAAAIKLGGKKGGRRILLANQGASRSTLIHEEAHLAPNRSSWRLHSQIAGNPSKAAREEARAEVAAGEHYRNAPKSGDSGYVQAARSEENRLRMERYTDPRSPMEQILQPKRPENIFSKEPIEEFRQVQDKMGQRSAPPRSTNEKIERWYTDPVNRRRAATGAVVTGGAGVYGHRKYKRSRDGKFASSGVSKRMEMPNDLISKSAPDQMDLHVNTAVGVATKGKLVKVPRPKYKDAISLKSSKRHTLGALNGTSLR